MLKLKRLTKALQISGLAGCLYVAAFSMVQPAQAQARWRPRDTGSATSTFSGGRRGIEAVCKVANEATPAVQTTLIVPKPNQSLLTVSAQPSFFWYTQTDQPTATTFLLSDLATADPLYEQTLTTDSNKLLSVTLPSDLELEPGKRYRWTVLTACDAANNSQIAARSFIERVEEPQLSQQVFDQPNNTQAELFAQNGIWYDAIAHYVQAKRDDPSFGSDLATLLREVGLTIIAQQVQ